MTTFLQTVGTGLSQGSIYALLAVGFVIIYKATHVVNFAHPSLMLLGASVTAFLTVEAGIHYVVAVPIAVLATAVVAGVIERIVIRPMVGEAVFSVVLITIGLDVFVRILVGRWIGNSIRPVRSPFGMSTLSFGGVSIQQRHVVTLAVMIVVFVALRQFYRRSLFGLAMEAAAFDQEAAAVQGISVSRVFSVSWMMAGGLAALAGALVATGAGVDQQTWLIALKALPAIIIGGLDSIEGALAGALVVGLVEALVYVYQPGVLPILGDNFALVSPYLVLVLVLLIRPFGLFGTREVERV